MVEIHDDKSQDRIVDAKHENEPASSTEALGSAGRGGSGDETTTEAAPSASSLFGIRNPLERIINDPHHPYYFAVWPALGVCAHIGWGLYPVFGRFLQTKSDPPLKTLQVLFCICFISLVVLSLFTLHAVLYRKAPLPFNDFLQPGAPGRPLFDWRPPKGAKYSKPVATLYLIIAFTAMALSSMYSLYFTKAIWVQLLNMGSPVVVSVASHHLFQAPYPEHFLRTLGLMTLGSVLAIAGGASSAKGPHEAFDGRDVLGIFLAVLYAVSLAAYVMTVALTKEALRNTEVLFINYLLFTVGFAPLVFGLERGPWVGLWKFSAGDMCALFVYALGVYVGANALQQVVIRKVGAPLYALFLGARLISACIGSVLLLGEHIRGFVEFLGLLIVAATITHYLYLQYRKSKGGGAAAGQDSGGAAPVEAAAESQEATEGSGKDAELGQAKLARRLSVELANAR